MKLHKHFPPHLAQLVFKDKDGDIQKINSIDYDLFLWLIYYTHKKYKDDKLLKYEFEYSDIKKSFKKSLNTNNIKESLKKIGELRIVSNYLQSYENNEVILTKPFEIEIVTTDNNISYGFIVNTTNKFMKWFDNPKPLVDVNYDIIYNLKSSMSKLLYLFLRDANGVYKNTKRYRNVDVNKLKDMMNVSNKKMTNSNFITELSKTVKTINEYSDLIVKFQTIKKRNLRKGILEIQKVKFTIEWDENKLFTKRLQNRKSSDIINENNLSDEVDTETDEYTFDDYLEECVEEEYSKQISNGIKIENPKGYKNGIRKNLLNNGIKDTYNFLCVIETEKNNLRESIKDNQSYMIVFRDEENLMKNYYINNDCLFVKCYDDSIVTKTINESLEFIENNRFNLYFDIQRCNYSDKYNRGRL